MTATKRTSSTDDNSSTAPSNTSPKQELTRRRFLQRSGGAMALFHIVPAHVLGGPGRVAPSEKLNIAAVGGGGRARRDIDGVSSENIIAIADVDDRRAKSTYEKYPKAKRYRDFRTMLDELDNQIDGVVVGTPDHTHAIAVMNAIGRGKHVYCEKPLSHSIYEGRQMMEAARAAGVTTQLGNQGHSSPHIRRFCELVWGGAIGDVTEIHATCQAFQSVYSQLGKIPELQTKHEIPKELDWNLWLGPASDRAYTPIYLPFNWRGWMDFGTGCLGDWVCHIIDPSLWALDLDLPTTVQAEVDPSYDPEKHGATYPPSTKITFQFPAKGKRGPVKLTWFDGNNKMPRPDIMGADQEVPSVGAIVYGTKGAIVHGSHGAHASTILPQARREEFKEPEPTIPRVKSHHWDWLDAIRNKRPAGSNFDYGSPLTEIGLLGAIAIRFPTQKLEWDAKAMKFTNFSAANAYVNPSYREGWTLRRSASG